MLKLLFIVSAKWRPYLKQTTAKKSFFDSFVQFPLANASKERHMCSSWRSKYGYFQITILQIMCVHYTAFVYILHFIKISF